MSIQTNSLVTGESNLHTSTNPLTGGISVLADGLNITRPSMLRAAIEAAYRDNAFNKPLLAPAPTWAVSTVYYGGMVVRGAAAGSTLNLYMCAGSTAGEGQSGTSAAAGGPTGTGSALITDGTVVWEYIGAATATGTYPFYSTVTPVTSTDVMNGYLAFVNQNNLAAMGLTAVTLSAAAPLVSLTNCNLTDAVTVLYKNSGTVAAPVRATSTGKSCIRFVTNAKKWIALCAQNAIYQYLSAVKAIKINGQFLCEQSIAAYTAATLNPGAYLLDLTKFPAGNKTIEVFFHDSRIASFNKIAVGTDEFVFPLTSPNNFKIALEGDSITDMTYLSSYDWYARAEVQLGEMLGSQNVLNNSIGGTGMIQDNSGTKTTYIQRLPDITAFAPDLLIIGGAHNDDSYTSAARIAAALAYFAAVRAALPNCTIAVQGGNLLQGELATQITVENDLITAFNTFNATDKNCFFIRVLTANPVLLSSNNGYMFQQGGVPAAYTNGHPCSWYYYHTMPLVANGVRSFYQAR